MITIRTINTKTVELAIEGVLTEAEIQAFAKVNLFEEQEEIVSTTHLTLAAASVFEGVYGDRFQVEPLGPVSITITGGAVLQNELPEFP